MTSPFSLSGSRNGRAKVTELSVLVMRRMWRGPGQYRGRAEHRTKKSTRQLARMFRLSQKEIWEIVRGRKWKHIWRAGI